MDALNAEVDRASNLLRKELDWMRRRRRRVGQRRSTGSMLSTSLKRKPNSSMRPVMSTWM